MSRRTNDQDHTGHDFLKLEVYIPTELAHRIKKAEVTKQAVSASSDQRPLSVIRGDQDLLPELLTLIQEHIPGEFVAIKAGLEYFYYDTARMSMNGYRVVSVSGKTAIIKTLNANSRRRSGETFPELIDKISYDLLSGRATTNLVMDDDTLTSREQSNLDKYDDSGPF